MGHAVGSGSINHASIAAIPAICRTLKLLAEAMTRTNPTASISVTPRPSDHQVHHTHTKKRKGISNVHVTTFDVDTYKPDRSDRSLTLLETAVNPVEVESFFSRACREAILTSILLLFCQLYVVFFHVNIPSNNHISTPRFSTSSCSGPAHAIVNYPVYSRYYLKTKPRNLCQHRVDT
jgi:hypothetical protein